MTGPLILAAAVLVASLGLVAFIRGSYGRPSDHGDFYDDDPYAGLR